MALATLKPLQSLDGDSNSSRAYVSCPWPPLQQMRLALPGPGQSCPAATLSSYPLSQAQCAAAAASRAAALLAAIRPDTLASSGAAWAHGRQRTQGGGGGETGVSRLLGKKPGGYCCMCCLYDRWQGHCHHRHQQLTPATPPSCCPMQVLQTGCPGSVSTSRHVHVLTV